MKYIWLILLINTILCEEQSIQFKSESGNDYANHMEPGIDTANFIN